MKFDNLSKTLQKEMSAVSGQRLVNLTVKTLEGMHTDDNLKNFFDTVVKKAQNHTRIEELKLPRKRNRPDYSILQYMEGYGQGAPANHPQRVDDLGSKADHDGPRSACSVRSLQSAFLRNPVRVFISKNKSSIGN